MSEQLDRMEAILVRVVERQENSARDIDTLVEAVSNLDVAIEATAAAGRATDARLNQLIGVVENNSQQIANNSQQIANNSQQIADNAQQIVDNSQQIANNAQQIAESNQRFNLLIERLDETNQRFDILLQEGRADRAEWRARFDAQEHN